MWLIPHVVIVLSTPVSGTSCSHHSLPEPYRLWLAEMVDIRSFIVFLSTAVLMASTNLPRYRTLHSKAGKRDTLTGSEAVNAVLTTDTAALCSLILFVDGKTSSRAVFKVSS
nr:uncharacterized protein LOC128695323 [Cherax quadricarinatus]